MTRLIVAPIVWGTEQPWTVKLPWWLLVLYNRLRRKRPPSIRQIAHDPQSDDRLEAVVSHVLAAEKRQARAAEDAAVKAAAQDGLALATVNVTPTHNINVDQFARLPIWVRRKYYQQAHAGKTQPDTMLIGADR